jgi:hypothetical protein
MKSRSIKSKFGTAKPTDFKNSSNDLESKRRSDTPNLHLMLVESPSVTVLFTIFT